MAFTEAEMKARWKAGIQDLNGDGKIDILDILTTANFARAEAEATGNEVDTSSVTSLASDVTADEGQSFTESAN